MANNNDTKTAFNMSGMLWGEKSVDLSKLVQNMKSEYDVPLSRMILYGNIGRTFVHELPNIKDPYLTGVSLIRQFRELNDGVMKSSELALEDVHIVSDYYDYLLECLDEVQKHINPEDIEIFTYDEVEEKLFRKKSSTVWKQLSMISESFEDYQVHIAEKLNEKDRAIFLQERENMPEDQRSGVVEYKEKSACVTDIMKLIPR